MRKNRPFILLVAIPLIAIVILGGLIFGSQAMSDQNQEGDIQRALATATALETSDDVELQYLQSVNYGYGVCGLYKTPSAEKGFAPFFYDTTNHDLVLDINSRRYKSNCSLGSLC